MHWGLVFSVPDPQAGELDIRLRALTPVRGTSAVPLQLVGCPPKGMGLDYMVSSPLLPISVWLLLYVFSCRRSFLVGLVFFINGCSVYSCDFGVLVRGDELRVFPSWPLSAW